MKRFRFKLESVLALRSVAELHAREQFGLAQQKVADARDALHAASQRRIDIRDALSRASSVSFRPSEQISGLEALRQAERFESDTAGLLADASAARDRLREEWLVARRGLQIMQRLEERAQLAHRINAGKAEQTMLDELASLSTARISALA